MNDLAWYEGYAYSFPKTTSMVCFAQKITVWKKR